MTKRIVIETVALSLCIAFASQATAEQNEHRTGAAQEAVSPGDRMGASGNAAAGERVDASTKQFILSAAGGGIAEVEMGRLALKKASGADVKAHAQKMIDDHTKANAELEKIASAKGVTVPTQPDEKHQQMLQKLSGLEGKDFDKAYMAEGGVKAHTEMQQLFKTEADSGKDPEVQAFAKRTLPVVEQHLDHSKQIAGGEKHQQH